MGSANAKMQRLAMVKLDWLVVRDFSLIEGATWWQDGSEIETRELRTEDIGKRSSSCLTWDYPTEGAIAEPDAEAVLAEINGWNADGEPLATYEQLNDDGSTACGWWIYCAVYTDGVNQTARRKPGGEQNWVALERGWAWPANRHHLYKPGLGRSKGEAVE